MAAMQKITWAERDGGEKFSIIMFALLAAIFIVGSAVGMLFVAVNDFQMDGQFQPFTVLLLVNFALCAGSCLSWLWRRKGRS